MRSPGQVADLDEILGITVTYRNGVPILLSEIADVQLGGELRTGAATQNGSEVVLGTVFMLLGSNSREVARASAERIEAIQPSLPDGSSSNLCMIVRHWSTKRLRPWRKTWPRAPCS